MATVIGMRIRLKIVNLFVLNKRRSYSIESTIIFHIRTVATVSEKTLTDRFFSKSLKISGPFPSDFFNFSPKKERKDEKYNGTISYYLKFRSKFTFDNLNDPLTLTEIGIN